MKSATTLNEPLGTSFIEKAPTGAEPDGSFPETVDLTDDPGPPHDQPKKSPILKNMIWVKKKQRYLSPKQLQAIWDKKDLPIEDIFVKEKDGWEKIPRSCAPEADGTTTEADGTSEADGTPTEADDALNEVSGTPTEANSPGGTSEHLVELEDDFPD
ncbi:Arginine-tRNA-protein transferase [Lasiodiplodia theobromae]|uniref:Arginine-tRNA-protein transferase n=1 Tax=Lasiodiplodia theobromae TaxID=45133 RepID=UPI0015C3C252|nr:Arginine-tRNA-protein transferase [Lasiodiplodia theobromae]KAF4534677.1 Arginine-tRNA-protein transferase [Lasiodiplodia theobromae]